MSDIIKTVSDKIYKIFGESDYISPTQKQKNRYYAADLPGVPSKIYPVVFLINLFVGFITSLTMLVFSIYFGAFTIVSNKLNTVYNSLQNVWNIAMRQLNLPFIDIIPFFLQNAELTGFIIATVIGVLTGLYLAVKFGSNNQRRELIIFTLTIGFFIVLTAINPVKLVQSLIIGTIIGLIVIFSGILIGLLMQGLFEGYVIQEKNNRGRQIDEREYSVAMTIAKSQATRDASAEQILKILAESENVIPEMAKEAQFILRLMSGGEGEELGQNMSFYRAVYETRNVTPSEFFKSMLGELAQYEDSGGDLTVLFENEIDKHTTYKKRKIQSISDSLEQLVQMYIIPLVGTGIIPIFTMIGIISVKIVSIINSFGVGVLTGLVLFVITQMKSPLIPDVNKFNSTKFTDHYSLKRYITTLPKRNIDMDKLENWEKLKIFGTKGIVERLRNNPEYTLGVTIPFMVIYYVSYLLTTGFITNGFVNTFISSPLKHATLTLVVPVYVIGLPLLFFNWLENKRSKSIKDRFPEFLTQVRDISNNMDFKEAFAKTAQDEDTVLGVEARKTIQHARFTKSFSGAFIAFANRVDEPVTIIAARIINVARDATSDINNTLTSVATLIENQNNLIDERLTQLGQVKAIMAITVLIAIGIDIAIGATMLQRFSEMASTLRGVQIQMISIPNMSHVRALLILTSLMLSYSIGPVWGVLEDDLIGGFKVVIVYLTISVIGFYFFVPPV